MPDQSLLPTPLLRVITDLGDAFEQAWEAGSPQRLEDCLNSAPEDARPELFRRLLAIECDFRKRQGRPLAADEAHQRFAALGDWAVAILAERGLEADLGSLVLRVVEGPHAGDLGFYRMVEAGPDHWRVRYIRTLCEFFHLDVDDSGALRTDHRVQFLGITVFRMHYKLERIRTRDSDA